MARRRDAVPSVERATPDTPSEAPADTGAPRAVEPVPPRVALLIDLDNVVSHLDRAGDVFSMERIREVLRPFGDLYFKFAFVDAKRAQLPEVLDIIGDLDEQGVSVIACSRRGVRGSTDSVDERLKRMVRTLLDGRDVTAIAIAANDTGYSDVFTQAKDRRRLTISLLAEPEASADLRATVDHCFSIGSPFLREVARCLREIQMASDEATTRLILEEHRERMEVILELLRFVYDEDEFLPHFAPRFLRDRLVRTLSLRIAQVASREEILGCVYRLRDIGCFTSIAEAVDTEGPPRNRLRLKEDHLLVRIALGNDVELDRLDAEVESPPTTPMAADTPHTPRR